MNDKLDDVVAIFVAPVSYWNRMKRNFIKTPWNIHYYQKSHLSLSRIAKSLADLETRTWKMPTPPFVRSNFGLYGPGTIIALTTKNKLAAAIYFVGPSVFEKKAHIWTLIVDPRYRKKGYATRLLMLAATAVSGLADTFSYQTKTSSNALPLYLRFGPNVVITSHVNDTNGNWNNPKIFLEAPAPKNLLECQSRRWRNDTRPNPNTSWCRGFKVVKTPPSWSEYKNGRNLKNTFWVSHNDQFWRKIGNEPLMQKKYAIVGCDMTKPIKKIFVTAL